MSNGTSKYFKSSSSTTPTRNRNNKQKARRAAAAAAAAKDDNQNNNQRANLPSEVNNVRPATPIKSTAVTTPAGPIYKKTAYDIAADKAYLSNSGKGDRAVSPSITSLSTRDGGTSGSIFDMSRISGISSTPKTKTASTNPKTITPSAKVNPFGGAAMASIMSDSDPATRNRSLLQGYQNTLTSRDNFDLSSYNKKAASSKTSSLMTISDKYRNDEVSYNQAYWKARLDGGASQAEMAAEQKSLGSKKIYSGDRAVTKQDQEKNKYILDVLSKAGIKPTVTSKTSGLFNEMNTTTNSYDIGTGKPITTTTQKYSPKIGGVAFGDDVTKTFVNGVANSTKTGDGAAEDSELGSLGQTVQASADTIDAITTVDEIDKVIAVTKDPDILKSLYQRRLSLMRLGRTRTRFAGLLDDPDTKKSQMSIV